MSTNDAPVKVQQIEVDADQSGQRIDNFLVTRLKGVPKSAIYRMIRKGEVRVNKGRIKPEYKLELGDTVRIPPARTAQRDETPLFVGDQLKIQLEAAILFEDNGLIVLNKPSGLAVHGGSGLSLGVIEALRVIRPQQKFLELVHRLDRDTSGLLLVAKKRSVLRQLHDDLREGRVEKTYLALVYGRWNGRQHRIEAPLKKFDLASGERVVRVSQEGKPSLTLFEQKRLFEQATLVEAKPVTGRTHQIRVHAQFAGHPIAGDDKYIPREQDALFRDKGLKRLFLHAFRIEFNDIEGKRQAFEAPLPADLQAVLNKLQ
ncbi:MAG: 23S rRNA pseudouridine(955/2504/2580) synthase RluC [Gammaproteobacteria bacterium]|nr:23S rRNA pseudouridine(955/2504/2580) synthase RluC [Gammaproteobacteria bacterium]